ncbi:UNVERIFIED_CONTAM: hypothetical protein Sradi_4117400 [Sesamum radiatum]|uniref:Uncharacterized protein n=1 Tax=Sesamum radiatum TaxID=300843 RepID=A0AAW2P0S3_SESRA
MIFTQVRCNNEGDGKRVASSNYISNGAEEDVAQSYHITLIKDGEVEEKHTEDAFVELEECFKSTKLKEVNLGYSEDLRPIYTSVSLTPKEEETYITLFYEFKYVFAWSYKEMLRLDPKVVVHHLSIKKGTVPIKQDQRRF